MWSNNTFFQILREFFAMKCHVEFAVTSIRECESDNTKFNTPAPHSHLIPCNTYESHHTGEGKWLIGPNLDIFTCWQQFRHLCVGCTHFCAILYVVPHLAKRWVLFMTFRCELASVCPGGCIHPWLYVHYTVEIAKELRFWMDWVGFPFRNAHNLNKSW